MDDGDKGRNDGSENRKIEECDRGMMEEVNDRKIMWQKKEGRVCGQAGGTNRVEAE